MRRYFLKYSSRNRVKILQTSLTKGPYQWPPHIKVCLFRPTRTHIFVIMQRDGDACTDANRDIMDQSSLAWRLLRTSSLSLRPTTRAAWENSHTFILSWWSVGITGQTTCTGPHSNNEKSNLTIILCCLDEWLCVCWFAVKFGFRAWIKMILAFKGTLLGSALKLKKKKKNPRC